MDETIIELVCQRTSAGFPCELDGLYFIGATRREARRIDNKRRGRAGRQGDPSTSRISSALIDLLVRFEIVENPDVDSVQRTAEGQNLEISEDAPGLVRNLYSPDHPRSFIPSLIAQRHTGALVRPLLNPLKYVLASRNEDLGPSVVSQE